MVSPFDLKTVLLAKHGQHVALIHFPIAMFISAVAFDLISQWTKRRGLADAAYYNLLVAAISTVPVLATGILAWQFQLEGQKLKGILLLHLVLACVSTMMIWLVWWVHFRARRRTVLLPSYRLTVEFVAVGIVALTGHLGGFLSGVNGPG
ncbi:MAG: rubrerythrin-like protein [Acidobacteriaceae bacterium]|nr:rubrerythrin-like protein [Acidobacteriaceae bacterium]